jgi:hypothetical protein
MLLCLLCYYAYQVRQINNIARIATNKKELGRNGRKYLQSDSEEVRTTMEMETLSKEKISELLSSPTHVISKYWRIQAAMNADEEFLPRLQEMLLDPNEGFQVQLAVAKALLRLGHNAFVEEIAYSQEPQQPSTRLAAAKALDQRFSPSTTTVQRMLHEVWKEGEMWPQERDELKESCLDLFLKHPPEDIETLLETLISLLEIHESRTVFTRAKELLLRSPQKAAPFFAKVFSECRDQPHWAIRFIYALGEAGDPSYFPVICDYPDYVLSHHPHAYTDALASVISAAGKMGQYEWLREIGQRDLFSARPTWLRALGMIAQQQPQHRDEITRILRGYIKPRRIGPVMPDIVGNTVPTRYIGHPPGARLEDKPEDYSIPCHNTAVEILRMLGEDVDT